MPNARTPKAQAGIGRSRVASAWRSVNPRVIPRSVAARSSWWVAQLVRALLPDLAGSGHHILGRGHLRQTHRATRVQLLRGYPDLGPEPELTSIDEPA
jgi:hypothetical protein